MKTKKHKGGIIAKAAILLALFLTSTPAATAQEFIKQVRNHVDDHSVIREYKEGQWLVSDFKLGISVFSLLTDMGTTTQQLEMGYIQGTDSTIIHDFKIFRDTVFFCGQTWFGSTPRAIWGYFPMSGFPNVPVYYNDIPKHNSLDKIEVFSVSTTGLDLHVVMVGMSTATTGVIVDEIRTAVNSFDEYSAHVVNVDHKMTDLIQTDNYIMMADIEFFYGTPMGKRVVFMAKPTVIGNSIFNSTTYSQFHTMYNVNSHLLQHCSQDAVAVVSYVYSGNTTVMGLTSPFTYYAAINYLDYGRALKITDLAYNGDSKVLDILTETLRGQSCIHHIQSGMAYAGGTIPINIYNDDHLFSIDYLTTMPDWFIASGHDNDGNFLRYYRYHDYAIPKCADREGIRCEVVDIEWNPQRVNLDVVLNHRNLILLESFYFVPPINIICE